MQARRFYINAILLLVLSLSFTLIRANAATGLSNTAEFKYGARLDIYGQQIEPSLNAAAGLGLDWIAIDFDWAREWPDGSVQPQLKVFNQAMSLAGQVNLHVMISITNVPRWANTPQGPEPRVTASLVLSLARLYKDTLLAVELFPAANTFQGWGATPNPAAYTRMLQETQAGLQKTDLQIAVIAGGLTPTNPDHPIGDMDDRLFLEMMYKAGANAYMPIVGMRLPETTGEPMVAPKEDERNVLRHYEELRAVMLENNAQAGLIWVTGFSWPTRNLHPGDEAYAIPERQSLWLGQAYRLLRAQLYIGAAFFSRLNPPDPKQESPSNANANSLIQADASLHPVCQPLSQLISLDESKQVTRVQHDMAKSNPMKINARSFKP